MKKMSWKARLAIVCPILAFAAWMLQGAATYTIQTNGTTNQVITVTTASAVTVTLAAADYTLVHLNIQNDGSTASVSTDYAVMMNKANPDGTAVTMDASYTDGAKMIVGAGAAATFTGQLIPNGPDGPCEIQIQAVGHGCKMELIRGHTATPP